MFLAGILGTFEQDLVFLVVALVLFGRRLPDVANNLGRKVYHFRRGLDEMKSEITKPIREQIEAPLRDAANTARRAAEDAEREAREAADAGRTSLNDASDRARAAMSPPANPTNPESAPPGDALTGETVPPERNPFPYPRAPRAS